MARAYVICGLLTLCACTQDFNVFVADASVGDSASGDAATDSASDGPVDAGCVVPQGCLTSANACGQSCVSGYTTCLSSCTTTLCKNQCKGQETTCRITCASTCVSCADAGCASTSCQNALP